MFNNHVPWNCVPYHFFPGLNNLCASKTEESTPVVRRLLSLMRKDNFIFDQTTLFVMYNWEIGFWYKNLTVPFIIPITSIWSIVFWYLTVRKVGVPSLLLYAKDLHKNVSVNFENPLKKNKKAVPSALSYV